MQKWDFESFEKYLKWFTTLSPISFAIGVFNPSERCTLSASGYFFKDFFPEPPTDKISDPICPVGKITDRRVILDENIIFAESANNLRQFDFFENDKDFPVITSQPDYWTLLSHSCNLPKTSFYNILPCYKSSSLKKNLASLEANRPNPLVKDEQKRNVFRSIEDNMNQRYISLPEHKLFNKDTDLVEQEREYLIIDLDQPTSLDYKILKDKKSICSVSFEGLSYFQCRHVIRLARDLKWSNWDDNRVISKV